MRPMGPKLLPSGGHTTDRNLQQRGLPIPLSAGGQCPGFRYAPLLGSPLRHL
jgi:hypothetical protein